MDNAALAGFAALVLYRDSNGQLTNVELASSQSISLKPTSWQASPKSPLATIIPLNPLNRSVTIDSVMVDPYRRR